MYNVPHKFRQVCRLCLTLVNECDVAELQIYDVSSHNSAQDRNTADFRRDEKRANCYCSALSHNLCSCIGDNSLSVSAVTNNETGTGPSQLQPKSQSQMQTLHLHQNQTTTHYTPSVPSAADTKSSERERQLESDIAERSVFKSQSSSTHEQHIARGEVRSHTHSQSKSELPREERNHNQHQHQHQREETSVDVDITKISGTDNYGKEHGRDDSSPHLTFQIFNCLSIKVSRFPSNTFAKKRIYINYAHTLAWIYGVCGGYIAYMYTVMPAHRRTFASARRVVVCVIYVITTPHVKIIGNDWAAFIPWPINNRYQLFGIFSMNHFEPMPNAHHSTRTSAHERKY